MNSRSYSKWIGLVFPPVLAGLALWLANGGMLAAVETATIFVLWGCVVLQYFGLFGISMLYIRSFFEQAQAKALARSRFFRIRAAVSRLSQLIVIVALFLADRTTLAGLILVGMLASWGMAQLYRSRATVVCE